MRMRNRGLLWITALVGLMFAGAAQAADMPLKAPPRAAPVFSWTGFYIGAHFGGAWGTVESELPIDIVRRPDVIAAVADPLALVLPVSSHTINGFLGGAQAGYNWQVNSWLVLGVEGQFSWSDVSGSTPCILVFKCTTEVNWMASLAGRVGYTFDRTMLYAKVGVAWADSDYTADLLGAGVITFTASETRTGLMVGAGIEHAFLPNWSAKLEYNYMDFDTERLGFGLKGDGCCINVDVTQKIHLVKFGINYRLWGSQY
jgi:outer membrane immunogenic protein